LPRLAVLGSDQEEEIKRLCEEEDHQLAISPNDEIVAIHSNTPMIGLRVMPSKSSWQSHQTIAGSIRATGEREHLGLRYMTFSQQECSDACLDGGGEARRLEGQQLLDDPDAIVQRAASLLQSQRWEDITVGLAAVTGRRLTELLKPPSFTDESLHRPV
jgi:hypothetical protein